MKKVLAILLFFAMVTLSSCGKNAAPETTTDEVVEQEDSVVETDTETAPVEAEAEAVE